jgi:MFS family permease
MARVTAVFEPRDPAGLRMREPRRDLVAEVPDGDTPGAFVAEEGPVRHYRRVVTVDGDGRVRSVATYRLAVPWFAWLFALPVRRALRRPPHPDGRRPWWAPRDLLTARQAHVLGLLAAASLVVGYVNTLFTQTVALAARDFGVDETAQGVAGTVVRVGILLALPLLFLGDRVGRRRVALWCAGAAPVVTALGALAPSFEVLVATQTVGRPLGLALDVLIVVVAAEEMPRDSRAYAVSVLSMATGLGAGFAVMALPLGDLGPSGWRLVYVLPLVLLVVSFDLARRLPETERFRAHATAAATSRLDRRRLGFLAATAFLGNLFVAPASFFQNRYLLDVRGYSAGLVSLFTLCTATPAGIGVVVGGRLADTWGRRTIAVIGITGGVSLLVVSFAVGGWPMWVAAASAGICGGLAVPSLGVYRAELFPTGARSGGGGLITTAALLGGSVGLLAVGALVDAGTPYAVAVGATAVGQVLVVALLLTRFPETAHRELEELNPVDAEPLTR